MKRKPKSYRREKRKEQIMNQFKIWYQKREPVLCTAYRIAKALDMTVQKPLYEMLEELVQEGKLTCHKGDQSGRWPTNFYAINPTSEHYHEKFSSRRIVIKRNGKPAGQLEMAI